jgi:hypothetical protein
MASSKTFVAYLGKNMKRILIITSVLLVLYTLAGFFVVPAVFKAFVPKKISEAITRQVSVAKVAYNPFTFRLHVEDLRIDAKDGGAFVSVDAITANAELISALTFTPTLKFLVIDSPSVTVLRNADGSFNFSDLLALGGDPAAAETAENTTSQAALPAALVRRLQISNARFQWRDQAVSPEFTAAVTALNLEATDLGTTRETPGAYRLTVETDLGATLTVTGDIHLAALASTGRVALASLPLTPFSPYAAPFFKGRIEGGMVGAALDYRYPSGGNGAGLPAVTDAGFTLEGLKVSAPQERSPMVAVKSLAVTGVNLNPAETTLRVGEVMLSGLQAAMARNADGTIDFLNLLSLPEPDTDQSAPVTGPEGSARPWKIVLERLGIAEVSAGFTDNAARKPAAVSVGDVGMELTDLALVVGEGDGLPTIGNIDIGLADIKMATVDDDAEMVAIPTFRVDGVSLLPAQATLRIGAVSSSDGVIRVVRDPDGRLDLIGAVSPSTTAPAAATPAPVSEDPTPETADAMDGPSSDAVPAPQWTIQLDQLSLANFSADMTDHSVVEAPGRISVAGIGAEASGLAMTVGEDLPQIADAGVTLGDINITGAGQSPEIFSLSSFSIAGIRLDPEAAAVTIAEITSADGSLNAVRNPDGSINLTNTLLPRSAPPATPPNRSAPETTDSGGNPFSELPVTVAVERTAISGIGVTFTDRSLQEEAQMQVKDIDLVLENMTTKENERGRLTLKMVGARDGTLSMDGPVALNPPSGEFTVAIEGLSIIPGQPYYSEKISALITKGKIDSKGTLRAAMPWGEDPRLAFTGQLAVNGFGSVDKKMVKDLLNWESLYLSGVDIRLMPLVVRLEEVALTDYYARVAVNPDGSVNLNDVMARTPADKTPPVAGAAAETKKAGVDTAPGQPETPPSIPDIKIAKITLQGGEVDFSDNAIQPPFDAQMLDLGGTITGLSSEALARADVFLAGQLENQSPLKITGQINPLIEDQFTDIQIEFSDIDLSPFSPYTGKYLGRQLDKGKLTLILGYKISEKKLAGDNKVYLDQFTLGDSVDSPDAINLPLDLAIALLKDPSGRIELDLPVRGSLDDPEFSVGGVILQLLLSTITKVITAPFAALGSALGGGPELSYIDFEAGSDALTPQASDTLTQLAAAMAERPAVDIEVQGQVNPEPDSLRLRDRRLLEMVEKEKLRDLLKRDASTPPEAAKDMSPEDFAVYMKRVYEQAEIPKPRNPDGSLKALPTDEMEKLVYTSIRITGADLRRLAMNRAEAATAFILADDRIESGRVFLREPDMTPEVDKDGQTTEQFSRVNFAIRK